MYINISVRTKNIQLLLNRLEWPSKKIYGEQLLTWKPVQQEKKCVFSSTTSTSRGYRDSHFSVSASSPLHLSNLKGKNQCPEKAHCAGIMRLLHHHVLLARFTTSINTITMTKSEIAGDHQRIINGACTTPLPPDV